MRFKHRFLVPTKDFKKSESVELWVDTYPETFDEVNQEIEYRVQIPDFLFNELADSQPKYTTTRDINNREISGCFSRMNPKAAILHKFSKMQHSTSLGVLREYFNSLTSELNEKYTDEFISKKKKIFVKYSHSATHASNGYNGAYVGKTVRNYFQYFIGYEVTRNMDSELVSGKIFKPSVVEYITHIEYHSPQSSTNKLDSGFKEDNRNLKLAGGTKPSAFAAEYSIIDWTEEREAFCKNIQDTFEKINSELAVFLTNLDNEKFDKLIESNPMKLLN